MDFTAVSASSLRELVSENIVVEIVNFYVQN